MRPRNRFTPFKAQTLVDTIFRSRSLSGVWDICHIQRQRHTQIHSQMSKGGQNASSSLLPKLQRSLSNIYLQAGQQGSTVPGKPHHIRQKSEMNLSVKLDNSSRPLLSRSVTVDHYGSASLELPPGHLRKSTKSITSFDIYRDFGDNADENGGYHRDYYDDFTSVDWVKDSIDQSERLHQLKVLPGIRGKLARIWDSSQDWLLITLVALVFSLIAYVIDRSESLLVDLKRGHCLGNWWFNEAMCCLNDPSNKSGSLKSCTNWKLWPEVLVDIPVNDLVPLDFAIYIVLSLVLAFIAVNITLTTKVSNSLGSLQLDAGSSKSKRTIYTAYGSGVPEVKTILSGFIIRKYLGTYTLLAKSLALVFAIASGMSLGKEGPFVHLATCVGNIIVRLFKKFNNSELERRQILSAAASAGVALAFGSPLGGVLFSLEEVSYYLPGNQLFKTFVCSIMSILFLRFLNPYGTGKTVLFEVGYTSDWVPVELILFVILGVCGGIFGGLFCKFTLWWASYFRTTKYIKGHPVFEVLLVAFITSIITFFNPYTKTAIPELLLELASPCFQSGDYTGDKGLCPIEFSNIPSELFLLSTVLVIKVVLTGITFGLKVPAGIYVPSMVIGALFGRLFAMTIQYIQYLYPSFLYFNLYADGFSPIIDFGIYAMISAGSFMAGITRMNITLAAIIFELTSSYTYVLPISIAIAVSNWVAYAIEPKSLYEVLLHENKFPFLANKRIHDFGKDSGSLRELVHSNDNFQLDVTSSKLVSFNILKSGLVELHRNGMIDGCIPIVKDSGKVLFGLLSAPELEFALDRIEEFCLEYGVNLEEISIRLANDGEDYGAFYSTRINGDDCDYDEVLNKMTDLTPLIERCPISIDISSQLSLVEIIFTKLGNRSICIFEEGKFQGFLHKKVFIDYCHDKNVL